MHWYKLQTERDYKKRNIIINSTEASARHLFEGAYTPLSPVHGHPLNVIPKSSDARGSLSFPSTTGRRVDNESL
jgi:hypothetical protein